MITANHAVPINRPIQDVYDFLADGLNNPKWRPSVADVRLATGDAGAVGAVYKQRLKGEKGKSVEADYKILFANGTTRIKYEVVAGPLKPIGIFDLESIGQTTLVRFSLSVEPVGLAVLTKGGTTKTLNAEVQELAKLKSVLEGR